jgi:hypothetical protein
MAFTTSSAVPLQLEPVWQVEVPVSRYSPLVSV